MNCAPPLNAYAAPEIVLPELTVPNDRVPGTRLRTLGGMVWV
jgi:hypothetical protein